MRFKDYKTDCPTVPNELNSIYMAGADVGELEVEYVTDALRNGWYENKYYYCETLEKEFAAYHNRKYALMTPNCTTSIHLILAALGIEDGDEVIVPECTWIASVSPVKYQKATPVFCDIEKDSWCLDPESVINAITEKTKAIIAVDLFGNMPNMDALQKICDDHGLYLIEDAAEALGSSYKGIKAGKFGVASTFSFHNTKTMTTGEGGMLLLDDDELYEKCVKLRDHGRGPNTKPYYNDMVGFKYMPFNVQAALGLAQFHRVEELIRNKKAQYLFYKKNLSDLDLQFNHEPSHVFNSAWITAIVLGESYDIDKHEFMRSLNEIGVPTRPFFYPLTSIPAFDMEEEHINKNINAYQISSRGFNLPGAANLTEEQLKFVCDGIRSVLT